MISFFFGCDRIDKHVIYSNAISVKPFVVLHKIMRFKFGFYVKYYFRSKATWSNHF